MEFLLIIFGFIIFCALLPFIFPILILAAVLGIAASCGPIGWAILIIMVLALLSGGD